MINTTRAGPREVAAVQTWLRAPAQQWVEQAVASDGPLYSTALCLLLLSPQVEFFIVSSNRSNSCFRVTLLLYQCNRKHVAELMQQTQHNYMQQMKINATPITHATENIQLTQLNMTQAA